MIKKSSFLMKWTYSAFKTTSIVLITFSERSKYVTLIVSPTLKPVIKEFNLELNEADNIIQNNEPKIPLPLLNTTQNVFTAISRCVRRYVIVN